MVPGGAGQVAPPPCLRLLITGSWVLYSPRSQIQTAGCVCRSLRPQFWHGFWVWGTKPIFLVVVASLAFHSCLWFLRGLRNEILIVFSPDLRRLRRPQGGGGNAHVHTSPPPPRLLVGSLDGSITGCHQEFHRRAPPLPRVNTVRHHGRWCHMRGGRLGWE